MTTLTAINTKIATLANAEKVTKSVLSELSRDLIDYVLIQGTHDIAAVNRTLAVLTPMNKQTAVLFFGAFLPHKMNEDTGMFGGLDKKAKDKKLQLSTEFLADESNDIWSWAKDNVKVEAKEVDYIGKVTKAISQAIEKGHASQAELVKAVLAGGLDVAAIMAIMQSAVPADAEGAETMGTEQPAVAIVVDGSALSEADLPY